MANTVGHIGDGLPSPYGMDVRKLRTSISSKIKMDIDTKIIFLCLRFIGFYTPNLGCCCLNIHLTKQTPADVEEGLHSR